MAVGDAIADTIRSRTSARIQQRGAGRAPFDSVPFGRWASATDSQPVPRPFGRAALIGGNYRNDRGTFPAIRI
jgi:hypothetical protein